MEIIITNGGNSESWYRNKVGQRFTVVDCKLHSGDRNGKIYNVYNQEDGMKEQSTVWKKDCAIVLARSAPDSTEILNEVKADKGLILTEEELKQIIGMVEYDIEEGRHIFWGHAKLLLEEIARLKELELSYLSANAELSFENMMRKRYEGFLKVVARSGEELEDHQNFEWFKVRTAIFSKKEELK